MAKAEKATLATEALKAEHGDIEAARVKLEQQLIGWQLADSAGAAEALPALRAASHAFEPVHANIVHAIGKAADARSDTSPAAIALRLAHDDGLKEVGGRDYLLALATAAPALGSQAAGRAKIESTIRAHAENVAHRDVVAKERELVQAILDRSPHIATIAAERVRLGVALTGHQLRIRLVSFNDIALGEARRDLVRGILPRVGMAVVWGPPKCGKSFWMFDIAMHVALGWDYRGQRVHQGPVVYCAFEGQTGMEARAAAFRLRFMGDHKGPVPFYLQPVRLDLVADHAELIATIRAQMGADAPVLVVLDTLNRSIRGSESNDADMSAYIGAADAIREAFGCLRKAAGDQAFAGRQAAGGQAARLALGADQDVQSAHERQGARSEIGRLHMKKGRQLSAGGPGNVSGGAVAGAGFLQVFGR